jgi:hypothetical protein
MMMTVRIAKTSSRGESNNAARETMDLVFKER